MNSKFPSKKRVKAENISNSERQAQASAHVSPVFTLRVGRDREPEPPLIILTCSTEK